MVCNQAIFEILDIIHVKNIGREFRRFIRDDGGRVASKFSGPPFCFKQQVGYIHQTVFKFGFILSAGTFIPEAAFIPLRAIATAAMVG
jgi:hypothetical protein